MKIKNKNADRAESQWLSEQRINIENYLVQQSVQHGGVASDSDWFVSPYVSIWRVESIKAPGATGWWAISGDLPTDYLSANDATSARAAMSAFARRWLEVSDFMLRGEEHPTIRIGNGNEQKELGDLLGRRARIIEKWAQDNELW